MTNATNSNYSIISGQKLEFLNARLGATIRLSEKNIETFRENASTRIRYAIGWAKAAIVGEAYIELAHSILRFAESGKMTEGELKDEIASMFRDVVLFDAGGSTCQFANEIAAAERSAKRKLLAQLCDVMSAFDPEWRSPLAGVRVCG